MKTMKKILFFAVSVSLLLLTGCSKEMAQAVPEATSVDPYEVKSVRIHISGNPYEWTNEDNPSGKFTVEYTDENGQFQVRELEWGESENNVIRARMASIRLNGFYYTGDKPYTYLGIVTDMELGNNTGEPYYQAEFIGGDGEALPVNFNVPVSIAHDESDFDIYINLQSNYTNDFNMYP